MALVPLSRWLHHPPKQTVAFNRGEAQTSEAFQHRVQSWVGALGAHPGDRWAVYHHDAYEFLAIVFALWQLGRLACIPGGNQSGSSRRLSATVDGFAGEFNIDGVVPNGLELVNSDYSWTVLDSDFEGLEIYTSGSTGDPAPIRKTIAQLELEVASLEALWPQHTDAVVLATVTHQHLYGLTFRLFWPLSSGRAFERLAIEYTEDILHLADHYASFSLVSSPSHLARLNTSIDWAALHGRCQYILSSAAPLARADSLTAGQLLGARVGEIYGSSETGAIAWRSQQDSAVDALWHPLPEVKLKADAVGILVVNAPYVDNSEDFTLSDRVEFCEADGFKLIGRIDRVVKVEGKRVSLAAIEKLLLEHAWIKQARALTVERRRVETAVVVQLTAEGLHAAESLDVKEITGQFRQLLRGHFEAVVLPRRWRIVDQMPYNQQGKLPLEDLRQLFVQTPVMWPEIIHQDTLDNQLTITCRIQAELIYFEGHFPDNPILPGIVQVHWAEAYGRQFLAVEGVFDRLEVIKFQQVITPGTDVTIRFSYDAIKGKLSFSYESDKGAHSSGRICFRK